MTSSPLPRLNLARQNIIILAVCLVILAAFLTAFILPAFIYENKLDLRIPEVKAKVKANKGVQELKKTLDARLAAVQSAAAGPGHIVKPVSISLKDAGEITAELQGLAAGAGVELKNVKPDIVLQENALQALRISAKALGKLNNQRDLLISLLRLPYLREVEEINLESAARDIEMNVVFTAQLK